VTEWAPATEIEAAMRDALLRQDQELYFQILAGTDLFLPVSAEALAGQAPMGWGTWTTNGRTHVLAFTSSVTLRACLGESGSPARRVTFAGLAASWPNLEWWLAVNPGLPIEGWLPAWFVTQLARGDTRLPDRAAAPRDRPDRAENVARARATAAVPGSLPPAGGDPAGGRVVAVAGTESESTAPRPPAEAAEPSEPSEPSDAAEPSDALAPDAFPALTPSAATTTPIDPTASATPAAEDRRPVAPRQSAPPGPSGQDGATIAETTTADYVPANEVEESLLAAAGQGGSSFLSTLLLAKVLLPTAATSAPGARPGDEGFTWRTETVDGETCVLVFTSPERITDHLSGPVETVEVKFVQLISRWPDETWSFVMNPGTPVGAKLPGTEIVGLASWAAELGLGDDAEGDPAQVVAVEETRPRPAHPPPRADPDQPTMMQKAIASGQVDYYLYRGYDRVSGFVHRAAEVAHLTTPAKLYAALGFGYVGSPFSREAGEIHVLRWPAHRPSLYRIPYGGQNETAMRAMEGWVIERAPFRGNGFAPGDSSDVVAEFKVDSVRLPHGAQLWRFAVDGSETLIARLDSDASAWRRVEEG